MFALDSSAMSSWQMIVSVAGALASWIGAAVVIVQTRRSSKVHQAEFRQKYNELADSRETFWTILRESYAGFVVSRPDLPKRLEGLVEAAGLPPDLTGRRGRDLRVWPQENLDQLNADQRALWDFVARVYPPRDDRQGKVTDYSIVEPASTAESFHKARGDLARFWHAWVPLVGMRFALKHYKSAQGLLILLSWLEIALLQWTRDRGTGKNALFQLSQKIVK